MAQLTAEQVERTIEACRAHLAEMGETFRANLDCEIRLSDGEPRPFAADALSPFEGPGLAVSLVLGEQGLLLLIPEPIPLPAWYRQPGISENNRLQTFAHELSLQLLPADLQADRYSAAFAESLKAFAETVPIDPAATALDLLAFHAEADAPLANILVVFPVDVRGEADRDGAMDAAGAASAEGLPVDDDEAGQAPTRESESAALAQENGRETDAAPDYEQPPTQTGFSLDQALRALRILNVPVTVSVRLAERKMPLGQIVALVPGALVPFNKSCEDLLDLFVNNYRYCQGEAIKIGEHFGIKIAKVGVTEERKANVL